MTKAVIDGRRHGIYFYENLIWYKGFHVIPIISKSNISKRNTYNILFNFLNEVLKSNKEIILSVSWKPTESPLNTKKLLVWKYCQVH